MGRTKNDEGSFAYLSPQGFCSLSSLLYPFQVIQVMMCTMFLVLVQKLANLSVRAEKNWRKESPGIIPLPLVYTL